MAIGATRTAIGFSKARGQSLSSYWLPASYVVEDANPNKVVITYAKKPNPTLLVASNFAVSGHTVSSGSLNGTGLIYTLTLADNVLYGESLTLTITGGTNPSYSITNNVLLDVNASAFLTAASITDDIQTKALNKFVKSLKAINATQASFVDFDTPANSCLQACYPFIGGSAAKHKFNLINPADSDAAFRLTFAGGYTNDEKGFQANGSTGWADTHLVPATVLNSSNHGLEFFCNNWTDLSAGAANPDVGCWNAFGLACSYGTGGQIFVFDKGLINGSFIEDQFTIGLHLFDRSQDGAGHTKIYRNNKLIWTSATDPAGSLPNVNSIGIGRLNNLSYWTDRIMSYVGIRKATISDSARTLYANAILQLQIDLSRCSFKNIVFEGHSMMFGTYAEDNYRRLGTKTATTLNITYANRIFAENSAVPGCNITQLTARYAAAVTAYKRPSPFKNILPIWIGVNDLGPGSNATIVWNALKSYVNQAIIDGWKPILLTATKSTAPNNIDETQRGIFNGLMLSDTPVGAVAINLDLHSEFSDPTNTTYFYTDGLHMIGAGYAIIAADLVVAINNIT